MVLGLSLIITMQAFVNMAVSVGLMPVTGQPLPLISMGGSSVFFTCIAMGMILGVSRESEREQQELEAQQRLAAAQAMDNESGSEPVMPQDASLAAMEDVPEEPLRHPLRRSLSQRESRRADVEDEESADELTIVEHGDGTAQWEESAAPKREVIDLMDDDER